MKEMKNIIFTSLSIHSLHINKFKLTGLLLLISLQLFAQSNNPSASSLISFEQYEIDPSTGMPNINIPLYSMPTRASEVNINLQLNYHPSSVAVFSEEMGDCGHGWSLQKGGVVYRTVYGNPNEYVWAKHPYPIHSGRGDLYEFRFMGFSGKFVVERVSANQLQVFITENKGTKLELDIDYDPTTYVINSFTFYDDNGISYQFNTSDEIVNRKPNYDNTSYKSTYHLDTIKDNNNNNLVNFNYNSYSKRLDYHEMSESNTFHYMKEIEIPDIGSIEFTGIPTSFSLFDYTTGIEVEKIRYDGLIIKDYLNTIVKEYSFTHSNQVIHSEISRIHLTEVNELNNNVAQSYKFEYKSIRLESDFVVDFDHWGYYNLTNKWCVTSDISKSSNLFSTNGVLQKILLPTGGSIIYEYEQNTYSHTNNKALDSIYNSTSQSFETDNNFYYRLDPIHLGNNLHNYNVITHSTEDFGNGLGGVFPFTINTTGTYYFKFDAIPDEFTSPEILDPEGNPIVMLVYPVFTLKKEGVTIYQFTKNILDVIFGYENQLNAGLGKNLVLTSGNYTIEMSLSDITTGSVKINKIQPLPQPKKWWYGGGIRVKKIGYFTETVDRRYYQNNFNDPQPVKETTYNYNFFDQQDKSSGYLKNDSYYFDNPFWDSPNYSSYTLVRYKNVTVRNYENNGKTELVYTSPIDDLASAGYSVDQRFGRLLEAKVYDDSGTLLHSTEYDYETFVPVKYLPESLLIWNIPRTIITKEYLNGNSLEKSTVNEYDLDLKIRKRIQSTSQESDTLYTFFYYDKNNSIFSKNRNVVERVENYRNEKLLSTTVMNYSKVWPALPEDNGVVNLSYMPLTKEVSKGNSSFHVEQRVNLYDQFGNIVELENQAGIKSVNIWGYNKTQIVAKIENIAYNSIPINLRTAIHAATNDAAMLSALTALRNHSALANAMVTTYTYIPLVGIKTMTDPKGYTMTYHYDNFNRLEKVTDMQGNILSENEYHYRTQN